MVSDRPQSTPAPGADITQSVRSLAGAVLIIDDDIGTRETMGRLLTLQGYAVLSASNGEQALLLASNTSLQAILLNFYLPEIDGLALLRRLRALDRHEDTRVVLLSADWDVEQHREELRALDATFLWKLCDPDDVMRVL